MRPSIHAGLALLVMSGAALAQQPLTLPGRAQSSGQQAVDNAACYAFANSTTKVNMARESQVAPKTNTVSSRSMASPGPVAPPLPPTASGALAASATGASAPMAASGAKGASATAVASASAPVAASGAIGASGALAATGASDAIMGGDMKMPPLPPPEPPMVRYWRAYSDCMQGKGYYVK